MLSKMYVCANINLKMIFFIDAITNYGLRKNERDTEETFSISNSDDLTNIGMALKKAMNACEDEDACIVFDSTSTMLIYASSERMSKCMYSHSNKIRPTDVHGVVFVAKNGLDPGVYVPADLMCG